jgi:hypothetical protein
VEFSLLISATRHFLIWAVLPALSIWFLFPNCIYCGVEALQLLGLSAFIPSILIFIIIEKLRAHRLTKIAHSLGFTFKRNGLWKPEPVDHEIFNSPEISLLYRKLKSYNGVRNIFYEDTELKIFGYSYESNTHHVFDIYKTVFCFRGALNITAVTTDTKDWIIECSKNYSIFYRDGDRTKSEKLLAEYKESKEIHRQLSRFHKF